jgi:hypothetical protein
MDIALLTCAELPELFADDRHLLAPLRALGHTPHAVVWDDPRVDWGRYGRVLVRSVWDYFLKPAEWSAWLARVGATLPLYNPAELVAWNGHKRYLLELAGKGLAVTPTALVEAGARGALSDVAGARGWDEVVVKPAVNGGGRLTRRFAREQLAGEGQAHLEAVLAEGDALVQPFLRALQEAGERSYLFIDGAFSHAVVRAPSLGVTGPLPDGVAMAPRPDELALAARVVAACPTPTLYARVDLATGLDGAPVLQELEVIEPRLFLAAHAEAAPRLAAALVREQPFARGGAR